MAARLAMQVRLYRKGFISVSADEFGRGLRAQEWSQHLSVAPWADIISPWPPFEMYLNGLALHIFNEPLVTPRITVFMASCLLLIGLFFLARDLFASTLVAALAVSIVAVQPWYVWLSGTPMLEMYFLASFVGGLYFLVAWVREKRRLYWLFAALLFLLASGFHVQSWILINLVNLFTIPFFLKKLKQREQKIFVRTALFWLLGNAYILFWAAAEYLTTGQVFRILSSHTSYSLWFYAGYDVAIVEKLLYYPTIVWRNTPIFTLIFAGAGIGFVWRQGEREQLWRLLPLAFGCSALVITSIFNTLSGPPSAAPDRYSLFYTLLLAPYAAFGVCNLMSTLWRIKRSSIVYLGSSVVAGLLLLFLAAQIMRAEIYPKGMSTDTILTGRYLNSTLAEGRSGRSALEPTGNLMAELIYWDFLALQLMIEQKEKLTFDREIDIWHRDLPSLLMEDEESVRAHLLGAHVELIAVKSPILQQRAEALVFLQPERNLGTWAVFRVAETP
jgi:hypothetical protein